MGRLVDLAKAILLSAKDIEDALQDDGLTIPNFETDSLDDLPPKLHVAQNQLLEAADELATLVRDPLISGQHWCTKRLSVQFILRFNIANALPVHGTSTFSELAETIGQDKDIVERFIRHAITYRIFTLTSNGRVAHTVASHMLSTDRNLSDLLLIAFDNVWPAASRAIDALELWPCSQEPNHAGHNVANRTDKPFFVTIDEDPILARRFANTMRAFSATAPLSAGHLIGNLDLGTVSKLVDVGGSSGEVAFGIAREYPNIQCIVQDQPHVIEAYANETPVDASTEITARVIFRPHDFFHEQPIEDADVYLVRWILHDWSDTYAARILRNIALAMKEGARLVINESVLSAFHCTSLLEQRMSRCFDLEMLSMQNGRERDEEAWKALLRRADSRLVLREIHKPKGSALSIIVASM